MVDLPPLLRRQPAPGRPVVPDLLVEPRLLMLKLRSLLGRQRAVLDAFPDPVLLVLLPLPDLPKGSTPRKQRPHHHTHNHPFHSYLSFPPKSQTTANRSPDSQTTRRPFLQISTRLQPARPNLNPPATRASESNPPANRFLRFPNHRRP